MRHTLYVPQHGKVLLGNERLVFPDMMEEYKWMYDRVLGVVYFIMFEGHMEWILGEDFEEFLTGDNENTAVLGWAYLCTIRNIKQDYNESAWITQDEYMSMLHIYHVLDVVVRIVEKEFPNRIINVTAREWNDMKDRDSYDILVTMYKVTYKRRDL